MRTTDAQSRFIVALTGAAEDAPVDLITRVGDAFGRKADARQRQLVVDLLTILGDGVALEEMHTAGPEQLAAMRRNWRSGADDDALRARIFALRLAYDWPALQDVLRSVPASLPVRSRSTTFQRPRHACSPRSRVRTKQGGFLDARRLMGAKAALRMILHTMFYIDYETCIDDGASLLETHGGFAEWLGRRMNQPDPSFSDRLDCPEFIRGDVAFVSLNYDPIGLWTQFVANRTLNRDSAVPTIGSPARPDSPLPRHGAFHPFAPDRAKRATGPLVSHERGVGAAD